MMNRRRLITVATSLNLLLLSGCQGLSAFTSSTKSPKRPTGTIELRMGSMKALGLAGPCTPTVAFLDIWLRGTGNNSDVTETRLDVPVVNNTATFEVPLGPNYAAKVIAKDINGDPIPGAELYSSVDVDIGPNPMPTNWNSTGVGEVLYKLAIDSSPAAQAKAATLDRSKLATKLSGIHGSLVKGDQIAEKLRDDELDLDVVPDLNSTTYRYQTEPVSVDLTGLTGINTVELCANDPASTTDTFNPSGDTANRTLNLAPPAAFDGSPSWDVLVSPDGAPPITASISSGSVSIDVAPPGPIGTVAALSPSDASPHAYAPAIAYNPDAQEFLVVWQDGRATGSGAGLYAKRVSAGSGETVGTEIFVSSFQNCMVNYGGSWPNAVYNNVTNEYLVSWQSDSCTGEMYVLARRLESDGDLLGSSFSTDYVTNLSYGGSNPPYPSLAVNQDNGDYLVVARPHNYWVPSYGWAEYPQLQGRFFTGAGPFPDPGRLWTPDFSTSGHVLTNLGSGAVPGDLSYQLKSAPTVAYNPHDDSYLYTWLDARDYATYSLFMTRRWNPLTSDLDAENTVGYYNGWPVGMADPKLAIGPSASEYMIASSMGSTTYGILTLTASLHVVGYIPGTGFIDIHTAESGVGADVAYNPSRGEYFAVWRNDIYFFYPAWHYPYNFRYRRVGTTGTMNEATQQIDLDHTVVSGMAVENGAGKQLVGWIGGDGYVHTQLLR